MQTGVDQFTDRTSNDKSIHKNHFSEWKSHVMSSVNEKIHTLKNKLVISSINKLNERKAAKVCQLLIFQFLTRKYLMTNKYMF